MKGEAALDCVLPREQLGTAGHLLPKHPFAHP